MIPSTRFPLSVPDRRPRFGDDDNDNDHDGERDPHGAAPRYMSLPLSDLQDKESMDPGTESPQQHHPLLGDDPQPPSSHHARHGGLGAYLGADERRRRSSSSSSSWAPISSSSSPHNPSHAPGFVPALEGLRGVAVLMTVVCHAVPLSVGQDTLGTLGVTVFFVLSGFLITGVLLRLQADPSLGSYRHLVPFYADRFVRLVPALVAMIVGVGLLHAYGHPTLHVDIPTYVHYTLLSLFYVQNFPSLWRNWPGPFNNTWSLANEEQFYVAWSLLLPLVGRLPTRSRVPLLLAAISASASLRLFVDPNAVLVTSFHKLSLASNVWKMLLGSCLRLVPLPPTLRRARHAAAWTNTGVTALAASCVLAFALDWRGWQRDASSWLDPLAALATMLIICGSVTGAEAAAAAAACEPLAMREAGSVGFARSGGLGSPGLPVLSLPSTAVAAASRGAGQRDGGEEDGEGAGTAMAAVERGATSGPPTTTVTPAREQQSRVWVLESRWLREVGRVSYSFYLWDYPLSSYAGWRRGYGGVADGCVAAIISLASTYWLEEPLRRGYRDYGVRRRLVKWCSRTH